MPYSTVDQFWLNYLSGGYFDADGYLRLEYVHRQRADELARALADAGLTRTQLRRFFQHCRALETRLRSKQATWRSIAPDVTAIDSKAVASLRRANAAIPELFYDFLVKNVAAIASEKDFLEGFLPHYAAVVGFGAAYIND